MVAVATEWEDNKKTNFNEQTNPYFFFYRSTTAPVLGVGVRGGGLVAGWRNRIPTEEPSL